MITRSTKPLSIPTGAGLGVEATAFIAERKFRVFGDSGSASRKPALFADARWYPFSSLELLAAEQRPWSAQRNIAKSHFITTHYGRDG